MKRTVILGTVFATVFVLALPFAGGGGPSFLTPAQAAETSFDGTPVASTSQVVTAGVTHVASTIASVTKPGTLTADSEHLAQKPVPKPIVVPVTRAGRANAGAARRQVLQAAGQSCPGQGSGGGSAPGISDSLGSGMITGTTTADIRSFSSTFNAIRAHNCLDAVPSSHFRYDACMEQRLFWMAEDPSTDPSSAWGHMGSVRSDGVPSRGCDGNLAGGSGNTGATVATKWWNSIEHRLSLYRPSYSGSMGGVCIYFAMSHGGVPNEPSSFTRAAARWGSC
jgi:hypothetical protein